MTKELKSVMLAFRVRPSLKTAIDKLAAEDRRTVAEFVQIVLEDYIAARKSRKS